MAGATIKVELLGDSRSLERSFGRAAASSAKLRVGLGGLVKTAAGIVGLTYGIQGLSSALVGSVKASASFQQSLQRSVGLGGVAQARIKGLSDELLKLGPAVGKSPQELADALYFVASAGIAAGKQMGVVAVSAKAAAAGMGDTQTVADAVTSVLNAYGQANISAAKAGDILAATVREGKGEASDFAPTLGLIVPIAAKLGISFDQVGAALAAMTQQGTSASRASVQLSQFLSTLLKVTPQSAKGFASVGLNADKLRQELSRPGGLLLVLNQMDTAFGGNVKAMSQAIPNVRALRGVLQLVGKDADQVRGVFGRLSESTGSLGHAFSAVNRTTQQQFNRTAAAIQASEIRIGAALAPVAEQFAKQIAKIAVSLSNWLADSKNQERVQRDLSAAMKDAKSVFQGLAAVIVPLAKDAKDAADAIGGLKSAVKLLIAAMVAQKLVNFGSAMTGIGTQAATSTGRVNALRGALLRLGAIGVITLGIEILVNKSSIQKSVHDFLSKHGLGFLNNPINIPVNADLKVLEETRNKIAKLRGENDLLVKAYDKVIERQKKLNLAPRAIGAAGHNSILPSELQKQQDARNKQVAANVVAQAGSAAKASAKAAGDAFQKMFDRFDLALSKAQLTPSLKDDLKVLQNELAVVNGLLAKHKNNLDLQQKQIDLQGQILDIQKQQKDTIEQQRKAQQQALADAKNQARQLFGSLFQAPDLTQNPPSFLGGTRGRKTVLGTGGGAADLLANITAQNSAFARLESDIARLIKRGAPASLVSAARTGEISAAQVDALAHASKGTLDRIFSQVRKADKLITQAAKAQINAKTATVNAGSVNVHGTLHGSGATAGRGDFIVNIQNFHSSATNPRQLEEELRRRSKKRANQRRGRVGGTR